MLPKNYLPRLRAKEIDTGKTPGLVSVVLPVYNGAEYLDEAIASVRRQSYPDWELIVVDDGSIDGSLALAKCFAEKDDRIRVMHQENQKLPRALNNGFGEAKGEYYTWISADNRFLPGFLDAMVGELKKHPEADMVFGSQYLIDEAGERITGHGWFELPPNSGAVCFPPATPLLNTVANNTIGAAFLYRAGCDAVLGGYSPNLFLLEDYDYFMRMNSLFKIRRRKGEPLYEYRFHKDSLTAHDGELQITASRPRLMEFDAYRRGWYRDSFTVQTRNLEWSLVRRLEHYGLLTNGGKIEILSGDGEESPRHISYRVFTKGGYAVQREGAFLAKLKSEGDLAAFLRLRLLMETLREEEEKFFVNSSLPR